MRHILPGLIMIKKCHLRNLDSFSVFPFLFCSSIAIRCEFSEISIPSSSLFLSFRILREQLLLSFSLSVHLLLHSSTFLKNTTDFIPRVNDLYIYSRYLIS